MDTLQGMRVFAAVAEAGSFSQAADRLGLSRAMASKHVQQLEQHLGVRLLQRTTRKLRLTESGSTYFERCRQILADIDEAEADATKLTLRPSGVLRMTMPVSFGVKHVAPLIAPYLEKFPEVQIDATVSDRRIDLIEEGIDLAIRIGATLDPGLVARRLGSDHLMICAAPSYLARRGTPTRPEQLEQHDCALYSYAADGNEWTLTGPDGPVRIKVGGKVRANNGDILTQIVLDGGGLMCQPSFLVGDAIADGRLVQVLPDYALPSIGIFAVYPSRKYLSAKIRTFVDFMAESLSSNTSWSALA